jgi:hypothetical protein
MGQGIDLTGIEDQDLASHIQIASGLVNTYCNVDVDHDFRGGSITAEEHPWKMGNYMWPGSRRVYPTHFPMLVLSKFEVYVTNTQYLNIPVAQTHYETYKNQIETLIAASSIGVWSYSAIPVAGFREPHAKIDYTYGYSFVATNEQFFPDGGIRWRAQNQWWDSTVTPVITINGTPVDAGDLTFDYDEGTVDIDDDALTALDIDVTEVDYVRGTYTHKLPTNIMNATGMVATSLLGRRAIADKGLIGLSGIKVNEVELRQSRDSQVALDEIPGNAQMLLVPYRRFHWGA